MAVGTSVLSDFRSIFWALCPKARRSLFPSAQGNGREDFSAAGGIGKPMALLEQCQVPPGAPLQLQPGHGLKHHE